MNGPGQAVTKPHRTAARLARNAPRLGSGSVISGIHASPEEQLSFSWNRRHESLEVWGNNRATPIKYAFQERKVAVRISAASHREEHNPQRMRCLKNRNVKRLCSIIQ